MNRVQTTTPAPHGNIGAQEAMTMSDVIGRRMDGGNWMHSVQQLQGDGAVHSLRGLLDYAATQGDGALKAACESRLLELSRENGSVGFEAALVSFKDASLIVEAFFRSKENGSEHLNTKPLWQWSMEQLASQEFPHGKKTLEQIQEWGKNSELGEVATNCLKDIERREKKWAKNDALPLKDGLKTYSDGDCFAHAALGGETQNGFRCTSQEVDNFRSAVCAKLESSNDAETVSKIEESVAAYYTELLEVISPDLPGDDLQNRNKLLASAKGTLAQYIQPNTDYKDLHADAKTAIRKEFISRCSEKGFFFPANLAGVMASALNKPLSLFLKGINEAEHYDRHGRKLAAPEDGCLAIRFDARKQHFERVDFSPKQQATVGPRKLADPETYVSPWVKQFLPRQTNGGQ